MSVNKQIRDLINEYSPHESTFLNSSRLNTEPNILEKSNLYKSSQTKINKSYLVYTSPNKLNKNNNINLLIPANSLSYLEKNKKIKREIQNMNQKLGIINSYSLNFNNPKDLFTYTFHKDDNEKMGKFRNRPILNLNNNNFNFSPRSTITNQLTNRSLIEPGIFKASERIKRKELYEDTRKKKYTSLFDNNGKKYSKNGFNDEHSEFNIFMGEMNRFKQRKLRQWRKEFLEDNEKY